MKFTKIAAVAFLAACTVFSRGQSHETKLLIDGHTAIFVDPKAPLPLKKAANDLARDMSDVFGVKARVIHQADDGTALTIYVTAKPLTPMAPEVRGDEILTIKAEPTPWKETPIKWLIVLSGSDFRGSIYAVYEFSQRFLGVDPLCFWSQIRPKRQRSISVAEDLSITDGPPTFRHRGFFINDEDLLTGWRPGLKDGSGIALDVWDRIFETVLRLKGDMIVPGTFIFPDEPQVKAASDRGLIIAQHHIEVLGTNTFRWPDDKVYSFNQNRAAMVDVWRHSIEQYSPDQDLIWTLGYRGKNDRPFWKDDLTAGTTDKEHADTINAAVAEQIRLLHEEKSRGPMIMNVWSEAVPLLKAGLLKIPKGVTLVWADNGRGLIRDGGAIAAGQGVYYHTAMANYMANQLTEGVPLPRIQVELGRAARAHATEYLLINTSDVRPVILSTSAAMALAWNASSWLSEPDYNQEFLRKWCAREYGSGAASKLAAYYDAYTSAPAMYGTDRGERFTDNAYHSVGREILVHLIHNDPTAPALARGDAKTLADYGAYFAKITGKAMPRWAGVREIATAASGSIDPRSRSLFRTHVLLQLAVQEYSNLMLHELGLAAAAPPNDRAVPIDAALSDCRKVLAALKTGEHGMWKGFYRNDLFVDVTQTLVLLGAYKAILNGKPIPPNVRVAVYPDDFYTLIKKYQGKRRLVLK